MRKLLIIILVLLLLCCKVSASDEELLTEDLTEGLSDSAIELLPDPTVDSPNFWDDMKEVIQNSLKGSFGSVREGLRLCGILLCIMTLCSVIHLTDLQNKESILNVVGALGICTAITGTLQSMISLSTGLLEEMSTYGSVLLPALSSVVAMSGGISSAGALYAGTVIFSQILLQLITKLLIPLVYIYLTMATAEAALGNEMLSELREFVGWLITKSLRLMLYLFLAFTTITGVIGSTADAAAVKATKAAVSGMIPVVGSILSDASDTLLSGAALMKNSVGVFGMLAVMAICLLPIMKVGVQYLLLKITTAVGGTVGLPAHVKLLKEFSKAMGFLLAMCASAALLLLLGIICLMRVT